MEKLIEEVLQDAEKANEPGTLSRLQILEKGDDATSPMIASELKSAGYVYIYDTRTGDRSLCNRNMLPQHLKKKRPDGSTVFTTVNPGIETKKGTFKCLLHADSPDRAHYDELGFATCKKANLTSRFQVMRHMQKRHKMEWAAIEQERIDAKEQADRDFQRMVMGKVMGDVKEVKEVKPEVYESNKDRKARLAKEGE